MKKYLILGGLLAVGFATGAVYWPLSPTEKEVASSATQVHNAKLTETVPADLTVESANAARPDLSQNLIDTTAVMLLERYGESIDSKRTQARLLEEREKLVEKYPDFGLDLFQQAVAVAFPELQHEILRIVAKMAAYHVWLENSYLSLQEMSVLEREGRLWAKRHQMFSEDAENIWENGKAYMTERQALAQQYTGDQLKQELDSLRRQYFESSARTIELEESDGFFRFNRPRVYGRN